MKRWMVGLAALGLLIAGQSASAKGGKRRGYTPGPCGVGCGAGYGGCGPSVSYQTVTVYRDVTRTICELVPVTTEVEVEEVTVTPVKKTVDRTVEWYEEVRAPIKVKQTVHKMVQEKAKVSYGVLKPVTRDVEQKWVEYAPVTKKVPRTVR
jgi:hypothetical protein